jgi:Kef-type K+ transport system membrane component KefB
MLASAPVAPIAAHQLLVLLSQLGLLLGIALVLGRLSRRIGIPAIVGELCAGVVLGPSLLAHALPGITHWLLPTDPGQMHMLDAVGQLGVILLVGITGMNIDLKMVRRKGVTAAKVSIGGLVIPLGLGIGAGFLIPTTLMAHGTHRGTSAAFLGVAMCVSAIPVIAKTLLEMRLLHRNIGQLIVSSAAVDDIAGWLLLSVVSAMATTGVRTGHVALSVAYLVGVILFALVIGRPVVNTALRLSAKSADAGVTVTVAVVVLLLSAAGTQALGMEAIVGAFYGGILIGSSGWLDRSRLAPLRTFVMSVLAPIFFATAGLRMDLTALGRPTVLGVAGLILALAIIGKFVGVYLGARAGRLSHWEGIALGAGMNARGVIEVVIAMAGLRLGVLSTEMYTIIVLVAIVTSVMAPPMLRWSVRKIEVTHEEVEREKAFALG